MAKDEAPAGAPMWMVTFADLMSLLVCFFVLIISFSVPDQEKIKIVAGSMNDAFGFTREVSVTGMIEINGNPQFRFARNIVPIPMDNVIGPIDDDGTQIPNQRQNQERSIEWRQIDDELLEELELDFEEEIEAPVSEEELDEAFDAVPLARLSEEERFERIEEKLTEVIENHPGLTDLADNLNIQRVAEGLRIQLIDQAERSMFPLGSAEPYPEAVDLLRTVVAAVNSLSNPVWISGHTDALTFKRADGYDNWSLSLDRADITRRVLVQAGLDPGRIASVIGKGETEHLVPERPTDPRNRRISITLVRNESLMPRDDPPVSDEAGPAQRGNTPGVPPQYQ
ncbi:MAG: flagellar motor protein MotB [Pseudomonadota bacterium]